MYYAIVATLMLILPIASIGIEASVSGVGIDAMLVGKWFVFWAVGWRLLLAGLRQIVQPEYTAREILGLKADESLVLVRELGFANVAIGLLGVMSLWVSAWQLAAALSGGVFYALAGVNHLRQPHRNRQEHVAMGSDLWVAAVLVGVCISAIARSS